MEHWTETEEATERQETSTIDGKDRRWLTPTLVLGGIGVGAGLMYLLDPEMGRYRRGLARDRAAHAARRVGGATTSAARGIGDRALDVWSGTTRVLRRGHPPDEVLAARVRSKLARKMPDLQGIDVSAREGRIALTGSIPGRQVQHLIRRVGRIHGVRGVDDQLTRMDETGAEERGRRTPGEWMAGRRTARVRALAGVTGGTLAVLGMRRRGAAGALLGAASLFLLAQSFTGSGRRKSGQD